jgi:hypothetical protein
MTSWGETQPFADEERDAAVDLLTAIRNACNANIAVDRAWRLLGILAAVAGMASNDLKVGDASKRLHRHVDTLNEAVAQLEERPGG